MSKRTSFLGTGWGFPPKFSRQVGVELVSDETDILQSLEILLSTSVGERVMQPKFGCDMSKLLFEPTDSALQAYMKDMIGTAILYFEPRILLENVTLKALTNEGRIDVHIDFTVATTNTRLNYVYPFYIEEGTEIKK